MPSFYCLPELPLAQQIEVLWLGHATFRITSTTGKVIVIDPFLTKGILVTPAKYKDLKDLGKVDLILVTHGHQDHFGDTIELAKMTGATVVANYEVVNNLVALGMSRWLEDHRHEQGRDRGAARIWHQSPHGTTPSTARQ